MKLLTYSSRKHLLLASLLVLLSIPVFYLVANALLLNAVDTDLKRQSVAFSKQLSQIETPAQLERLKTVDPNTNLTFFDLKSFREQAYTVETVNPDTRNSAKYRQLQKQVKVFGVNHTLTVRNDLAGKNLLLTNLLILQALLLIVLLIGFLIINRRVNRQIWSNFSKTASSLKQTDGSINDSVAKTDLEIDELNDLNSAIQSLVQQSNTAQQLQKEFSEDAAHELQTPLAIIKSKLDLLLQEQGLTKNQSILIDQIYYVLQRLTDLNKNLLFLSKIENQQFKLDDQVDYIKTIAGAIESLNFFAEAKYQQVLFPRPEPTVLRGNQILIDQLIQNLTINAIQYSPKGSIINIVLTQDSLTFINEGKALDFSEEKLFSRFSKTIEKDQKGNGLGLAICKKIAVAHGFDVNYGYINAKHRFSIVFKKQNGTQNLDSVEQS